jgi:hypothetical protein
VRTCRRYCPSVVRHGARIALVVGVVVALVACGDDGGTVDAGGSPDAGTAPTDEGGADGEDLDGGGPYGADGADGADGSASADDPVEGLAVRCTAIGDRLAAQHDLDDVDARPNTTPSSYSHTDDPSHDIVGTACAIDHSGDAELLIQLEVPAEGSAPEDLQRLWAGEAIVSLAGDQSEIIEREQLTLEEPAEDVDGLGQRARFFAQAPAFGDIKANLYVLAAPDVGIRLIARYPADDPGRLLERDALTDAARVVLDELGLD